MSYRLPPLSSLRTFEAAVRHRSFKRAAEALHVTPAAVSQQIRTLESWLGVRLFVRRPGDLRLTDDGAALYPRIRDGLDSFAVGVESLGQRRELALDVVAPPAFATRWLVPRLARFAARHPEIAVRIVSDASRIDGATAEPAPGGRGESQGAAGAASAANAVTIRLGEGDYPGDEAELLQTPDYLLVCSPRLAARLRGPADLREVPLIHDESIPLPEKRPNWAEWFRLAGVSGIDTGRGPRFSNQLLALEAALDGQGVALALRPLVAADLAAGRLVAPFAITLPSVYAYYLVRPGTAAGNAAVSAFREWLLAECAGA